ncbi:hypothetical protein ANO11243_000720 [Dothideomycetidae sp. 11243]|nr:hypothetical protein ANO11243_000720 [fungal sp. No.11243]
MEVDVTSDHESMNRTLQDAAWNEPDLQLGQGVIALDKEFSADADLPEAQSWPWDNRKSIYLLMSEHELHCVHALREYINDNHDHIPVKQQFWSYGHMIHCLNLLRTSVMCNADDTPLRTGNDELIKAGGVFSRMCYDWSKLRTWTRERSACYRPVYREDNNYPELERYKFCPDGSQPWMEI